ncbi:MAG: 2-oxoacid ferredoxin oxidoreductase [candidate division Zixibacteria bacterium]|nr:2-oxoacid ferredoxin oxidoreductase [candidate division Zixibacteria bacterium]
MVKIKDYGTYETAWCPGCGNFAILEAVKKALVSADLEPHQVLFVSGIGQAAKAPHYLNANVFNGLHGRSLPVATGAKLANPELKVIVQSGDGCTYGEGGNHLLAAIRRNVDLTMLVHDNLVYGLTKGQASPTSEDGFVTKAQPHGPTAEPFNPLAVAVAMRASFVARGFSGEVDHLAELIEQALAWRGFSLVDILQPCVSFNKVNTFAWFKQRCYILPADHDAGDFDAAMKKAYEWGARIPLGVIYRRESDSFEAQFPAVAAGPLAGQEVDRAALATVFNKYA